MESMRTLMESLYDIKKLIVLITGMERDMLHIYLGVLILVFSCLLFRWRVGDGRGFLLVILAELANEANDIMVALKGTGASLYPFNLHQIQWPNVVLHHVIPDSQKDIILSIAIPMMMFIFARWSNIFERKPRALREPALSNEA